MDAPTVAARRVETFALSGFLVGFAAALVGPTLGAAGSWGHFSHDLLLAIPGAFLLGMFLGPDDVRDLGWSAGASLLGVAAGAALLIIGGVGH